MRSPLHDTNERLGARFVDFGGWEMPVQYDSVLVEHQAVRDHCGVFDVSHLGRLDLGRDGSVGAVERMFTNDVVGLGPGRTRYGMTLNDRGGIIDDLIVWKWDDDHLWMLPNAANSDRVADILVDAGGLPEDLRPSTAMLAVQGPQAPQIIEAVLGVAPRRFRTASAEFDGATVWMAGTGYTGERGGELVVSNETAPALLDALVEAGATPCGLGARDTLRLEAGLPLWGQDLDEDTTPLEAGLDFAVHWDHVFTGREALHGQRHGELSKSLVAFRTEGRLIPRHGYPIRAENGEGTVTSGNFSPTLQHGIGMGYLSPPSAGDLEVHIRGTWHPAERVDPPFLEK